MEFDFDRLDLVITKGKISSFTDVLTGSSLKSFHQRLTKRKVQKLYILREGFDILYVGTTSQSMTSRFRTGFKASGKNGYHGYKWKHKENVQLVVCTFKDLTRIQVENIEAELVYLIRQKTGRWPLFQNEIHFNNEHENGKNVANEIYCIL